MSLFDGVNIYFDPDSARKLKGLVFIVELDEDNRAPMFLDESEINDTTTPIETIMYNLTNIVDHLRYCKGRKNEKGQEVDTEDGLEEGCID